jgi:two-component system cell cycle response regulator DivK
MVLPMMNQTATVTDKPLILLVDDDEDSRFLYMHYLTSSAGYRVAEAANGQDGIDMAASLKPDVIVMDLSLPVLDGWEALHALKSNERTSSIPVVALTGHSISKSSNSKNGFNAVLVKPCLPEQLAKQCAQLLKREAPFVVAD